MITTLKRTAKAVLPAPVTDWIRGWLYPPATEEVAWIAALAPAHGMMVDVGAHVGGSTQLLLDKGWSVMAYEPDPNNRAKFLAAHGANPRVQWSPDAVSEEEGQEVALYASEVSTGISGLSAFHSSHRPVATVRTIRLDKDLARRGVRTVDFLKIDVEGFDFFALKSFDWSLRPRFVLYEFENHKTVPLGYTLADSAAFMAAQGYQLLYSVWEPIVEYGLQHTWRGLYREPPADAAESWGNVLCFRDAADAARCMRRFS